MIMKNPVLCLGLSLLFLCVSAGGQAIQGENEILARAADTGGLIMHVGCGDGRLTARLGAHSRATVHGLDTSAERVIEARRYLHSRRLYGRISASHRFGERLPYTDNLVNLVAVEDGEGVPEQEILRILCPLGHAYTKRAGQWKHMVKPWPDDIDEWTHWLHDASGNAVARDARIGPPNHYQWFNTPLWSRDHDTVFSVPAMVSAGGRVFHFQDRAPAGTFSNAYQGNWFLICRDAFNGKILWDVPVKNWGWKEWGDTRSRRFSQPIQLPKRLVADGDHVYTTLEFEAPLVKLDARTGEVVHVFREPGFADEVLIDGHYLVVSSGDRKSRKFFNPPSPEPGSSRASSAGTPKGEKGRFPLNDADMVKRFVRMFDLRTNVQVWETRKAVLGLSSRYDAVARYTSLEMIAHNERIFFASSRQIHCLDMLTGEQLWTIDRPEHKTLFGSVGTLVDGSPTLVASGDRLLFCQPTRFGGWGGNQATLYAFDAATGREVWSRECQGVAAQHNPDVFVIKQSVWVHDKGGGKKGGQNGLLELDLGTGAQLRRISTDKIFNIGHHHRCYRNKATVNYVLTSRRGAEFTDLSTGDLSINHWVGAECKLGFMLANGFLYSTPDVCSCYGTFSVKGFNAFANTLKYQDRMQADSERLVKGPAYTSPLARIPVTRQDWPIYRHDIQRSGFSEQNMPGRIAVTWEKSLGAPVSQAVVFQDQLYVAQPDTHSVLCLGRITGNLKWRFTTEARIITSPTAHSNRVVFGGRDGWVYCLTDRGELVWKFRAAPQDRLMMDQGQLESVWPVFGSILVKHDIAFCTAGRSSYLDGGIMAYGLDVKTGKVVHKKHIIDRRSDPIKVESKSTHAIYIPRGANPDIPLSVDDRVFMNYVEIFTGKVAPPRQTPHLVSTSGFLDDSRFSRAGWSFDGASLVIADQVVFTDERVYGVNGLLDVAKGSVFIAGTAGYTYFMTPFSAVADRDPRDNFLRKYIISKPPKKMPGYAWSTLAPVRGDALALSQNIFFACGIPDVVPQTDPFAAFEGHLGAKLLLLSVEDGRILNEYSLSAAPVWDGMSLAYDNLFLSLKDGRLQCWGP